METEIQCTICGTDVVEGDELTTGSDEIVCQDCMRMCDRCETVGTIDDDWNTVDNYVMWCIDCTDSHANYCDGCQEFTTDSITMPEDRHGAYCENCIQDAYYCDDCDAYYFDGCDTGHDDDYEDNTRIIHDYSYRPDAIFHSTDRNEKLYFGIEIEVEAPRNRQESSTYAQRLEPLELAYLKNDGSLSCGFEIVTHPMSHDFYMNEADELWETLEKLRTEYRVKSWDATTCGLHIHISRTGFGSGAHMHRFLNLVYSNQPFYEALAGRSSERWAKFDDIIKHEWVRDEDGERVTDQETGNYQFTRKRTFKDKIEHGRETDRYSAVNMQNRETLEMRIFRGSVNSDTVKAQLDLAHASVEYTRTLSVKQVIDGALTQSAFIQYISENESLYPRLVARISRCNIQLTNSAV